MRLMVVRNLRFLYLSNRDLSRYVCSVCTLASSLNCQLEKSWISASMIASFSPFIDYHLREFGHLQPPLRRKFLVVEATFKIHRWCNELRKSIPHTMDITPKRCLILLWNAPQTCLRWSGNPECQVQPGLDFPDCKGECNDECNSLVSDWFCDYSNNASCLWDLVIAKIRSISKWANALQV